MSALALAEQALSLADQLGLEPPVHGLGVRGVARCDLGDAGGLDDMRDAIAQATLTGQGAGAATVYNNLGVSLRTFEGPAASLEVLDTAIAFAQSRGLTQVVTGAMTSKLDPLFDSGDFDAALELAADDHRSPRRRRRLGPGLGSRTEDCGFRDPRAMTAEVEGTLDWLETTTRGNRVDTASVLLPRCLRPSLESRSGKGRRRPG